MNAKENAVLNRIKQLEEAITKAREYLDDGRHPDWHGFRPLFSSKKRDGKDLPPHRDWVQNVFIPGKVKALKHAEKVLRTMGRKADRRASER